MTTTIRTFPLFPSSSPPTTTTSIQIEDTNGIPTLNYHNYSHQFPATTDHHPSRLHTPPPSHPALSEASSFKPLKQTVLNEESLTRSIHRSLLSPTSTPNGSPGSSDSETSTGSARPLARSRRVNTRRHAADLDVDCVMLLSLIAAASELENEETGGIEEMEFSDEEGEGRKRKGGSNRGEGGAGVMDTPTKSATKKSRVDSSPAVPSSRTKPAQLPKPKLTKRSSLLGSDVKGKKGNTGIKTKQAYMAVNSSKSGKKQKDRGKSGSGEKVTVPLPTLLAPVHVCGSEIGRDEQIPRVTRATTQPSHVPDDFSHWSSLSLQTFLRRQLYTNRIVPANVVKALIGYDGVAYVSLSPMMVASHLAGLKSPEGGRWSLECYSETLGRIGRVVSGGEGRAMRFGLAEFFYADVDRGFYSEGVREQEVRRGRGDAPARFSRRFVARQVKELEDYRRKVRVLQGVGKDGKGVLADDEFNHAVPARLKVGSIVSALARQGGRTLIHRGVVLATRKSQYVVQFERQALGIAFVEDTEISAHGAAVFMREKGGEEGGGATSVGPNCDVYGEMNRSLFKLMGGKFSGGGGGVVGGEAGDGEMLAGEQKFVGKKTDEIAEREGLIRLMSNLVELQERKKLVMDCLEGMVEYEESIAGRGKEAVRSYLRHMEWLKSNLAHVSEQITHGCGILHTAYSACYGPRERDDGRTERVAYEVVEEGLRAIDGVEIDPKEKALVKHLADVLCGAWGGVKYRAAAKTLVLLDQLAELPAELSVAWIAVIEDILGEVLEEGEGGEMAENMGWECVRALKELKAEILLQRLVS